MEPPHKLAIAEAQVRAEQTHPPAFVRHVISGRGRSTCRSPAPPGRLFRSLALAQPGRWKADAGAAFPPPAAPRGRHSSGSRRFRAPRPSEVPGSPFKRRSAPRGAPCGAPFALPADRDTFAEFPGLFPAPSLALSRSVFALALATARAFMYASLPLGSIDLPPAYVSRQGPPRNLAQLAGASGGGCGARRLAPSRRLLDADWRAALRRSAEASGACIRHARIAFRFWVGAQGPGPIRERNRHEQPTHTS